METKEADNLSCAIRGDGRVSHLEGGGGREHGRGGYFLIWGNNEKLDF